MFFRLIMMLLLFCGESQATQFYAVIAGVNQYETYSVLEKCVASATDFKTALVDSLGWDNSHITLLLNSEVTEVNVIDAIKAMPRSNGNTCLFFFAGHGTNQGTEGIVMQNGVHIITPEELENAFLYNASGYNQFCCFIDACASGIFPNFITSGVICSSCDSTEFADDDDWDYHTNYSEWVLYYLNDKTQNECDIISAESIQAYVMTPPKFGGQYPQINDNYSGDLILGPHHWVIANGYYKELNADFNPLGDISILYGGGLTIDDNVTLYMNDNKKIEAQGNSGYLTLGENAKITKVSGGTYWSGLDINHGGRLFTNGDSIIEYAVCGIDIQDSSSFENGNNKITIRNCTQAGLWVANGSPTVNNFFFDNVSNSTYQNGAITVTGTIAHPSITRVTIDNTYFGMRVSSTYACTSVDHSCINSSNSHHSFQINSGGRINLAGVNNICPAQYQKAINNASYGAIDARYNYWGTPKLQIFRTL